MAGRSTVRRAYTLPQKSSLAADICRSFGSRAIGARQASPASRTEGRLPELAGFWLRFFSCCEKWENELGRDASLESVKLLSFSLSFCISVFISTFTLSPFLAVFLSFCLPLSFSLCLPFLLPLCSSVPFIYVSLSSCLSVSISIFLSLSDRF